MTKWKTVAIARSMESLGKGLGRPVLHVATAVGPGTVTAWWPLFRSKGFALVRRPWGAEFWK